MHGTLTRLGAAGCMALAMTQTAQAGALDRSLQPVDLLFERGTVAQLSFGLVSPSVSGTDAAGQDTGNVARNYTQLGFGVKGDVGPNLSFALIADQPFGADVRYDGDGSALLGGTQARASTTALTALGRYRFDNGFSVHGGLRAQTISADVTLDGLAYGGLAGYNADLASDTSFGYVLGVAYEVPDIALRVALTYNSRITHDMATTETGPMGVTESTTRVESPQSVNLDFQTGVAPGTLVFGQVRWAEWSQFEVRPQQLDTVTGGTPLLFYRDDRWTYTLGVGRQLTERLSGAVQVSYEASTGSQTSPLGPTDGFWSAQVGLSYEMENVRFTGGLRYIDLGNATAATGNRPDQPDDPMNARAEFTGNSAIAVGLGVTYRF